MRRWHLNFEMAVSGCVVRECINPDCTMEHLVTLATDEQARLEHLVEQDAWVRLVAPLALPTESDDLASQTTTTTTEEE